MLKKVLEGQTPDGKDVILYTFSNTADFSFSVSNFGANIRKIITPDRDGVLADVVLGFDDYHEYFKNGSWYGCAVVPHANRIGDARFTLNGKTYELDKNDGENNLHSGCESIAREIYDVTETTDSSITFTYHKADSQNGFPGNVTFDITYSITDDNALQIVYRATSDADTLFNPTNHSYFNLAGEGSGTALNQHVWIDADAITLTDEHLIPNGQLLDVTGTPFDFRTEKPLGADIDADDVNLKIGGGYDHNFVLKTTPGVVSLVATMFDEASGRFMEVLTDRPGVQIYSANFVDPSENGKSGHHYYPRDGVCFETQIPANSINVPSFPQAILKAGETITTTTVYRFSCK